MTCGQVGDWYGEVLLVPGLPSARICPRCEGFFYGCVTTKNGRQHMPEKYMAHEGEA